jgi:hypothetical protein
VCVCVCVCVSVSGVCICTRFHSDEEEPVTSVSGILPAADLQALVRECGGGVGGMEAVPVERLGEMFEGLAVVMRERIEDLKRQVLEGEALVSESACRLVYKSVCCKSVCYKSVCYKSVCYKSVCYKALVSESARRLVSADRVCNVCDVSNE